MVTMPLYTFRAIANGLHTDHPVPDLPFVDDSHIPVEDPEAVEATGRHSGTDMWGRFDPVRRFGGGGAVTTDPGRPDPGWGGRRARRGDGPSLRNRHVGPVRPRPPVRRVGRVHHRPGPP